MKSLFMFASMIVTSGAWAQTSSNNLLTSAFYKVKHTISKADCYGNASANSYVQSGPFLWTKIVNKSPSPAASGTWTSFQAIGFGKTNGTVSSFAAGISGIGPSSRTTPKSQIVDAVGSPTGYLHVAVGLKNVELILYRINSGMPNDPPTAAMLTQACDEFFNQRGGIGSSSINLELDMILVR